MITLNSIHPVFGRRYCKYHNQGYGNEGVTAMRSQDGALDACKSASVGAVKLHLSHTGGIRSLDCEFYVTFLCDVCGRVLYFFSGSFPVIQYYPTNQSMDLH